MGLWKLSAAAILVVAGAAQAAIYFESEDNDSLALANDIGIYGAPGDGILVDGTIGNQDVDWFRFTLTDYATLVVASVFDRNNSGGDGILGLFNSAGNLIVEDDDEGIGLMPSLQYAGLAAGSYYFAVSGYDDFGYVGDHPEQFDYKLVIGINIPTPGVMTFAGLGGLACIRRRRA
ncbi:MAG: DVUA0089 family protein [Phycisphaeraceae bacterium]|nr:MAG: DVUA0089 family protein [Phycisphaeraceae bacterium]